MYALLPVIGTLFIIMAGENAYINKKVLSHPLFVGIGLISYPLYLWHWSLLSFSFILEGQRPNKKILFTILIISVILSWVTYQFIEKPIKSKKDNKLIPLILVFILACIGIAAHSIVFNKGYNTRKINSFDKMSSLPQFDDAFLDLRINCSHPFSTLTDAEKDFADPFCATNSTHPKFLVLGNSHVLSFAYNAMVLSHLDLTIVSLGGNPTFLEHMDPTIDKKNARLQKINDYREYVNILLKNYNSIEYVVIVSTDPSHAISNFDVTKQDFYVNGYVKIIRSLLSQGKKVIFVIDFPTLDLEPRLCVERTINLSEKSDCVINKTALDNQQKKYRELINDIQKQVPSLLVYDPTSAFCDDNTCYGKKNHIIYYGDKDHLNLEGSKILIQHFKIWLKMHNITFHTRKIETEKIN